MNESGNKQVKISTSDYAGSDTLEYKCNNDQAMIFTVVIYYK